MCNKPHLIASPTQTCSFHLHTNMFISSPHKHVHLLHTNIFISSLSLPCACLKKQMVSSSAPLRAKFGVRRTGKTVLDSCRDTDADNARLRKDCNNLARTSVPIVQGLQHKAFDGSHAVFVTLQHRLKKGHCLHQTKLAFTKKMCEILCEL